MIELLDTAAKFSVLIAVITYCAGRDERKQSAHSAAWQILNAARGHSGNGGRIDALELLVRDSVPLNGIDLRHAWLVGADLHGARLANANLDSADLSGADLRGVGLRRASLRRTILRDADLRNAESLWGDFRTARLDRAKLHSADLSVADLTKTMLCYADLSDALFSNLTHVEGAQMIGADLRGVRWRDFYRRPDGTIADSVVRYSLPEVQALLARNGAIFRPDSLGDRAGMVTDLRQCIE